VDALPFFADRVFPLLLAEETVPRPAQHGKDCGGLALDLDAKTYHLGSKMGGVIFWHNGEILIGLLALYLGCSILYSGGHGLGAY